VRFSPPSQCGLWRLSLGRSLHDFVKSFSQASKVRVTSTRVSCGPTLVGDDRVTNLGFFSGPVHLTLDDFGIFVLGGAVPEPSTWAMMLLGFAGLGFAGYRRTREPRAA
jgi:hypothetical protein